jgi:hypothetical protein
MPEISLANAAPLRSFKIDIRDKAAIKALFYKLDIRAFGWNLPTLLEKYCLSIDPLLPEEYHYRSTLKLVAVLISVDEDALLDNPSATFPEENVDTGRFVGFLSTFVDELKASVCDSSRKVSMSPNSKAYLQTVYGHMTNVVHSKIQSHNPAIPTVTALLLVLLANSYSLSFCKTSSADIIGSFVNKAKFDQ